MIAESGLYCYPPEGGEEPVDGDNHALDALRYQVTGIDRGRAIRPRPDAEPQPDAGDEPEPTPATPPADAVEVFDDHWFH